MVPLGYIEPFAFMSTPMCIVVKHCSEKRFPNWFSLDQQNDVGN